MRVHDCRDTIRAPCVTAENYLHNLTVHLLIGPRQKKNHKQQSGNNIPLFENIKINAKMLYAQARRRKNYINSIKCDKRMKPKKHTNEKETEIVIW